MFSELRLARAVDPDDDPDDYEEDEDEEGEEDEDEEDDEESGNGQKWYVVGWCPLCTQIPARA
jgi:hypothetical protein